MKFSQSALALAALGVVVLSSPVPSATDAVAAESGAATAPADPAVLLRLSPSQYRHSIHDIFGASIKITGRFEPETRSEGMLSVGARLASITDSGLQRYDELARGIAAQVVDERHRDLLIPCKPQSATGADAACARQFFARVGRMLYRRPLAAHELDGIVAAAGDATSVLKNFYGGLQLALTEMLISPEFLFRRFQMEPDPERPGQERLNAYGKAAELSFFLWNTTPDEALLRAAESGEIHTRAGLEKQVDRLMSSPAMEDGLRGFFADMLEFADFETVSKDPAFFPSYTLSAKLDSQEQTLRTIVDHVMVREGDYRDLFTTRHTFLTRSLAALYGVPLVDKTENGQPQRWLPYTYPEGDPHAGILTHASFLALHSPSGRSSPTDRGKALRELLMCQRVPPPPSNVDFSVVQDVNSEVHRTARDRLTAHATEATCAGCHRITDPIGLALENFDAAGGYRTHENGAPINPAGEINRVKFDDPIGLGQAIRNVPAITNCVARKAFAFGSGRMPVAANPEWKQISQAFADSNYNVLALLREIALSDLFYAPPAATTVASTSAR